MIDLENVDIEIVEVKISEIEFNKRVVQMINELLRFDEVESDIDTQAVKEAA